MIRNLLNVPTWAIEGKKEKRKKGLGQERKRVFSPARFSPKGLCLRQTLRILPSLSRSLISSNSESLLSGNTILYYLKNKPIKTNQPTKKRKPPGSCEDSLNNPENRALG